MACRAQESARQNKFQGHPPRKPHLLPSDHWTGVAREEAEENMEMYNDMVTGERGGQGGWGGGGCVEPVHGLQWPHDRT